MGLETGTWIEDLVITNPPSTDDKRQGDDHLRLIKSVLKNSLKRTSGRAFYIPTVVTKAVDYTVLAADDNTTFEIDTTAQPTLTLPSLTVDQKGWCIEILKTTTDDNAMYVVPPSGTINGYTQIRRSVEGALTRIVWTGTEFWASRPNGVPIGAILDFYGTILPHGHEWPDGGSLNLTDFVELVAVIGATKPDLRGRVVAGMDDIGGNDASRLIDFIDGNTLGGVAGTEGVALTVNQLAQHSHSVAYGSPIGAAAGSDVTVLQSGSTVTGNQGATQAHLNLQPTMVMGKIIVAE